MRFGRTPVNRSERCSSRQAGVTGSSPVPPIFSRFARFAFRSLGKLAGFAGSRPVLTHGGCGRARHVGRRGVAASATPAVTHAPPARLFNVTKIQKTESEWRAELTPEQYRVLREKGTERPFSGEYDHVYEPGHYRCAGCGAELFSHETKYDSSCGWPAFYAPAADEAVDEAVTP